MRARLGVLGLAGSLIWATPSAAATVYTFEVAGTTDFSTDGIQSYSFTPQGAGGTLELTKEVDATSVNILEAVSQGASFSSAAFIAYDTFVSPQTELFRYTLNDLAFTAFSLNGLTETFSVTAATVTFAPAGGATLFTFSVDGTTSFDTSAINSYVFFPAGDGGTLKFTKDIDAASVAIAVAVAQGTFFPGATFIGYDDVIAPDAEVFRYLLSNIFFTSSVLDQDGQTVTVQAGRATLIEAPASVPEPGIVALLLAAAALGAGRARKVSRTARDPFASSTLLCEKGPGYDVAMPF